MASAIFLGHGSLQADREDHTALISRRPRVRATIPLPWPNPPSRPPRAPRPASLISRVPPGGAADPDEILDRFVDWAAEAGFELYPAQEEALLEIMAGKHVILNTPTGSGKSLVALGLHFKALCEGKTSFYTSPIKALASEKFFALCDDLGPENVGMLTGDASINPDAPVICCTAEVLSNRALREGERLDAPYVIMDEFHYYSDPERGVAWQIPLITLPHTRFLLMSATLGDVSVDRASTSRTAPGSRWRWSAPSSAPSRSTSSTARRRSTRPSRSSSHAGKAPIYIVNFTQRECAELAQALTSVQVSNREEREKIRDAIGDFRFDTPYGKECKRFISFGIGVHHAGLLPKYRLLVEQLSQQGLLRGHLRHGHAGRRGQHPHPHRPLHQAREVRRREDLDPLGARLQADRRPRRPQGVRQPGERGRPGARAHHREAQERAAGGNKKVVRGPPPRARSPGTRRPSRSSSTRPPETLSRASALTPRHGAQPPPARRRAGRPHPAQLRLAARPDPPLPRGGGAKRRLLTHAAVLVRSLYRAGIIAHEARHRERYLWAVVAEDLQWDFSLHQALSLYLVETIGLLDPELRDYALDLITLVESILEDPDVVLRKQVDKLKDELVASSRPRASSTRSGWRGWRRSPTRSRSRLHLRHLQQLPGQASVGGRRGHPAEVDRPRDVRGLHELRGLREALRPAAQRGRAPALPLAALQDARPERPRAVEDRGRAGTPSASSAPWSSRPTPACSRSGRACSTPSSWCGRGASARRAREILWLEELLADPKTFAARVRAEMHLLVRALSLKEWEEAADLVKQDPDDPETLWDAERFEAAMAPFFEEYGELPFTPEARRHQWTQIRPTGDRHGRSPTPSSIPRGTTSGPSRDDRPAESRRGRRADRAGGADRGLRRPRWSRNTRSRKPGTTSPVWSMKRKKANQGRIDPERGRPVAVLIGLEEFERLSTPKPGFWQLYQEFRRSHDLVALEIDPDEIWGDVRDPSPGRDFEW